MQKIQTVSLIGLGAIGASYGSKLNQLLGDQFRVIANQERIHRYRESRFTINGEEQPAFHYVTPETKVEPADLVIFATKNAELRNAMEEAQYHIGEDTIILSLLNGISSEEEIYEATNNKHILYSMCVGIDAVRNNTAIRYSSLGKICYGERDKSVSEDVLRVKELFDTAGVPCEISEDIWHTLWAKFMFNVGINQTSAVLKAPYDYFQNIPALHEWMESAMYEVVRISEHVGVHLTEEDVKQYRPILQKLSPDGQTSMLQDILAGRKTEVEYFAGKVCELGQKYNIPTPVNDQLYKIIHILEEMEKHKQSQPV
ncbi:ketopantoate reductase family protein [Oceanobacillus piezotolerans]|uniref:2-dehydropantoate 2-reductase n=1 Tax=Oceanobacillus piezotolerans TaxID=2448030 RepID=A0A498D467_9BACI|nr:ketopantoate reductase family protein [Oceanobacillus piezotolerans]RLL41307.1 ketopantoate reductase family protein [Oceanobacillus piezotolerans]